MAAIRAELFRRGGLAGRGAGDVSRGGGAWARTATALLLQERVDVGQRLTERVIEREAKDLALVVFAQRDVGVALGVTAQDRDAHAAGGVGPLKFAVVGDHDLAGGRVHQADVDAALGGDDGFLLVEAEAHA